MHSDCDVECLFCALHLTFLAIWQKQLNPCDRWWTNSSWCTHRNVLWQAIWHLQRPVIYLHVAPRHKLDDGGTVLWVERQQIPVNIRVTITCNRIDQGHNLCLTLLRISVLSRSFISMLRASSVNCGPRLQEIVMHALPGRSQSFIWKKEGQMES